MAIQQHFYMFHLWSNSLESVHFASLHQDGNTVDRVRQLRISHNPASAQMIFQLFLFAEMWLLWSWIFISRFVKIIEFFSPPIRCFTSQDMLSESKYPIRTASVKLLDLVPQHMWSLPYEIWQTNNDFQFLFQFCLLIFIKVRWRLKHEPLLTYRIMKWMNDVMLNVCVVLFYTYGHWLGASGFLTLRHGGKVSPGVSRFECETTLNAELIKVRSFASTPTCVHMGLCLITDIRFY